MIEISHLVKKYGDHYAVKDLNVRIEEGQIYGFLGPNGAGKSTTMNMITGYLAPTAGTVKVDGFDIVKEPEKAKEHIGYLPEIPPLYSEMTVEEYLKFAAELKRIPRKERAAQIEKAIKTAQLEDVRKRLINNLSKGYKQRVGLAQAVLGDPETIILDEPTVGLDPRQMIEMRELIRSLKKDHTVILSSHILSEVSAVCDQILIISKGELVASDTPDGLQAKLKGAGELELCVKGTCLCHNLSLVFYFGHIRPLFLPVSGLIFSLTTNRLLLFLSALFRYPCPYILQISTIWCSNQIPFSRQIHFHSCLYPLIIN